MTPRIGETIQQGWDRTTAVAAVKMHPAMDQAVAVSRAAAGFVAFALRPVALVALVCGIWRLGIDLGWTQDFFVSQGLLSHWQVWFAAAAGTMFTAVWLHRYDAD